tara:strand:- start:101996 stop:102349 length:354 start_codon:yes stop_codon:yes gene_type:complete
VPVKLKKRTIFWFLISQLVLVAIICLIPIPEKATPDINNFDKVIHLSVYIWLSWLAGHCLNSFKTITLLIVYGLAIELIQPMTGYRSFEFYDILANSSGVLLGHYLFKFLKIPLLQE